MHKGTEELAKGSPSTGNEQSLARTVDALRESLDSETTIRGWSREISAIGLIAGLLGVIFWMFVLEKEHSVILIQQQPIDVESLNQDYAWMGTAIEQGVRAQLLVSERVRFTSDENRVALGGAALPEPANPEGKGAGWRLGSLLRQSELRPDMLQLDIDLQRVGGEESFEVSLLGQSDALSDLAVRYVQQVQAWLKLDPLTSEQLALAAAELPADERARRAYNEALRALRLNDGRTAMTLLEEAMSFSPDHPLVNLAMAEAWSLLGYSLKANEYVGRAFELRATLSREKQLQVEGRYHAAANDWQRAEEIYRALWEFYPGDLTYGLALADAQLSGGNTDAALDTLAGLRTLPAPFGADPRIDLMHAMIAYQKGDWQAGLAPVQAAVEKARELRSPDLLATSLRWQFVLSSNDADELLLAEAQRLFQQTGNLKGLSEVLLARGNHVRGQGKLDQAERFLTEAMTAAEARGDEAQRARAMSGLAITMDLFGRLEEGLEWKRQVMASRERRSLPAGVAIARENIGHSLLKLGRLDEAEQTFSEAGREFAVVGDGIGIAWLPYHLSRIRGDAGDLEQALSLARQARENAETRPEGSLELHATFEMAYTQFRKGDLDAARQNLMTLISGYEDTGLQLDAAASRHVLARIELAVGNIDEAESLLMQAEDTFLNERAGFYLAEALTDYVDLLIHRFDLPPAEHAAAVPNELDRICERIRSMRSEHGRIGLRLQVRQVACSAREGRALDACLGDLQDIQTRAQSKGLFEPQLDAALLQAMLLSRADRNESAAETRAFADRMAFEHGWQQRAFSPDALPLAQTLD